MDDVHFRAELAIRLQSMEHWKASDHSLQILLRPGISFATQEAKISYNSPTSFVECLASE
jgi:hypothetical protein